MKRFLVFVLFCMASASCVELENICSVDHFEYQGVRVNSFYRVKQNVTFEPLAHYLIDRSITCDPTEFKYKSNLLEALKARNHYNRKFSEFYTEERDDASVEEIKKKLDEVLHSWAPLYHLEHIEPDVKCIKIFEDTAFSGYKVFETLDLVTSSNKCPVEHYSGYKPTSQELITNLRKLFIELQTGSEDQTLAFKWADAEEVYWYRGFALPRKFKFLKDDSGKVLPSTKRLMLIFDQFLPFHNKKHTDGNCVPAEELPLFYKKKGED